MDLAEDHIRNAGYGGFSFRDLAAEIGIKSASQPSRYCLLSTKSVYR
jgi:hypothetical protein